MLLQEPFCAFLLEFFFFDCVPIIWFLNTQNSSHVFKETCMIWLWCPHSIFRNLKSLFVAKLVKPTLIAVGCHVTSLRSLQKMGSFSVPFEVKPWCFTVSTNPTDGGCANTSKEHLTITLSSFFLFKPSIHCVVVDYCWQYRPVGKTPSSNTSESSDAYCTSPSV